MGPRCTLLVLVAVVACKRPEPSGPVDAASPATDAFTGDPASGACCEDGLTWDGCCGTPTHPIPHECGDPERGCRIACRPQTPCKREHP